MSGTENHISPLPFQELVARLRERGFIIGVEHHLRLSMLLDRIGWECHPAELKTLLCPIFARNEQEQAEFHRIFDELYPGFDRGLHQSALSPSFTPVSSPADTAPEPKSRLPLIAAGIALLVVLAALVYMALRDDEKVPHAANVPNGDTTGKAGQVDPGPAGTTNPTPAKDDSTLTDSVPHKDDSTPLRGNHSPETTANNTNRKSNPETAPGGSGKSGDTSSSDTLPNPLWLAVIIPPLYVLVQELRRYAIRRRRKERTQGRRLPYTVSISLDQKHSVLYADEEFHDLARTMRRRHASEGVRLDVEASVAATIGALGYPTFRYRHASQVPEYLFLIDRSSPRDHQAMLYHALARALEREGVFVASYWYDGDPRLCRSIESGETLTMEDLHARHGHRRLLIFGEGRGLLDPETGRLKSWTHFFAHWSERGLMTPANPRRWGREERTLASEFAVYPAHLTGVRTFIEHLGDAVPLNLRRWIQTEPSVPDDLRGAGVISVLRRYLGPDLFQWLCACAVYPELHWDLTLHLGALPCMKKGLITERNLLMLTRLEWFRAGNIPDDIRWLLMRALPHDAMRMTREAIVHVLTVNTPPEGTFAENDYELKRATQQWLLDHDRRSLRDLLQLVSISPKSDIHRDKTFARFLRHDARRPWDALLPAKLHSVVYRYGIPRLGLRTPVRVGMMLAVVGLAFGLMWVMMPVPPEVAPDPNAPIQKEPFTPPSVPDKNELGDSTESDSSNPESGNELQAGGSENQPSGSVNSVRWEELARNEVRALGLDVVRLRAEANALKDDRTSSELMLPIDSLQVLVDSLNRELTIYTAVIGDSMRVFTLIRRYDALAKGLWQRIENHLEDTTKYGIPTIRTMGEPYIFNISQDYLSYTASFKLEQTRRSGTDSSVIPVKAKVDCDDCAEFNFNVVLRRDSKNPFSWYVTLTASSYDAVMQRAKELSGRIFNIRLRLEGEGAPASVYFTITTQVQ